MDNMKEIKVLNKSFKVGSFYESYGEIYNCWTIEGSEELEEMTCFIKQTEDKKIFIDIGALAGCFSLFFSDDSKDKVSHAIDGSHEGMLQLLQNLIINKDKKIFPHKILIGDVNELRNYWTKAGEIHSLSFQGDDKIVMLTLDTFCDLYDVKPDVIKIDTEGYEIKILQNAHKVLSQYKPLIFMEGHNNFVYNYKNTIEELVDIAKKYQYKIYDLLDNEISYEEYLKRLRNKEINSTRTYWK